MNQDNDQVIYEITITKCYVPSHNNYQTLLAATSPTLEGVIDMANEFYGKYGRQE